MTLSSQGGHLAPRPLGQSEKRDIVSHTEHLLARLRERSNNDIGDIDTNLGKAADYATKATIRLVYVGFGFRIMHEHMPDAKAWKTFVQKYFPNEVKNADRYVAIGRHFRYDESYLTFLVGCNYAVPPKAFDEKRNIGSQLEEFRRKGVDIRCPGDLVNVAKNGFMPELEDSKKKEKSEDATPLDGQPAAANKSAGSDNPKTESAEFVFHGLATKLINSLTDLSVARSVFKSLAEERPVSEWDKATIGRLKIALRPAKEMLDELFEA